MAFLPEMEVTRNCLPLLVGITNDVDAIKFAKENQRNMQYMLEDEDVCREEAERVKSGYYLSIEELFDIFETKYDGAGNPFGDLLDDESDTLDIGRLNATPTVPSLYRNNWNTPMTSSSENNCNEMNFNNDHSAKKFMDFEDSLMSTFNTNSLQKLTTMKPNEIDQIINDMNENTCTESVNLKSEEVIDVCSSSSGSTKSELEMMVARTLCVLGVDQNESQLRYKYEKQFDDCVFVENGSTIYPILTNSNFYSLGYDLNEEIGNNAIIANEIFNDQPKSTQCTMTNYRDSNLNQQEATLNKAYDGNSSLPLAIFENKSLDQLKTILSKNKSRRAII